MDCKKFCETFSACAIFTIISFFGLAIVVDPLGVIDSPIIKGFNRYKSEQDVYEYVWKPYMAARSNAKVVFIGSSRVRIGWQASLDGYHDDKVFNLGLSSLSFPNMKKHLDCLYGNHVPEVLFIGIDFFQFGKNNYYSKQEHVSNKRLENLAGSDKWNIYCGALQDTINVGLKATVTTIWQSIKHKAEGNEYIRGFDSEKGLSKFNIKADRGTMKSYEKTYSEFVYEPKAMEVLKNIVLECRARGIKVYVFVNPIHKKLYNLLCSYGHELKWKEIKREVASVTGKLHELEEAEKYISNEEYFYDASHCNARLGEIMKAQILSN